jgi:hypothetical protein
MFLPAQTTTSTGDEASFSNESHQHQHHQQEEVVHEEGGLPAAVASIPACYLRFDDDVFFLDHTAIERLTLPPLDSLPEGVPPYLDIQFETHSGALVSELSSLCLFQRETYVVLLLCTATFSTPSFC